MHSLWRRSGGRPRPGDDRAAEFTALLGEHLPDLYRSAYRWTGHQDRAEDLVQDLLVRLYPRLDEIRQVERLRPWALRVMYRLFVDQWRREQGSPVRFGTAPDPEEEGDSSPAPEAPDPGGDPAAILDREIATDELLAAWRTLPAAFRVVVALHDVEGYTLVEISDMTGTELGTLKSRLHRARARLRALLTREPSAPPVRVPLR